jgi:hypothetical protein
MQASPSQPAWPIPGIARWLLLGAWFLYFSRDVLGVRFSPDDMMNIDHYWSPGLGRLIASQFLIWRGYYRPMGGLFYLPILAGWGLNPVPYHVVLSVIVALNVYLVYRLARLLGAGEWAATLAALVACYHAGLGNLYYNTAFVYDALCGCFYLASLVYYCGIRSRDRMLTAGQTAIFALLFLCALNSKEMALTLPGVLLAYEWVYHLRGRRRFSVIGVACVLTLFDVYGKWFGVDALAGMEGYRPVFTWKRFADYQKTFVGDTVFWHTGGWGLILFWASMSYLAWRPGARPILRFCWLFLLFTPLPIAFLPGKSQACLYIPMVGLAVFAAVILVDLAGVLAEVLAGEPIFRRAGRYSLFAGLIGAAIFFWGRQNLRCQRVEVKPVMAALGDQTWQVIEQFRAVNPHVKPGSHVVFLHDPFAEWDMLFIADLWFRDHSVTVHLQRLAPLADGELAGVGAVFDYRDGQLLPVR